MRKKPLCAGAWENSALAVRRGGSVWQCCAPYNHYAGRARNAGGRDGAFYSILILSFIMFAQVLVPVPEYITRTLGAEFILLSLFASLRDRKQNPG